MRFAFSVTETTNTAFKTCNTHCFSASTVVARRLFNVALNVHLPVLCNLKLSYIFAVFLLQTYHGWRKSRQQFKSTLFLIFSSTPLMLSLTFSFNVTFINLSVVTRILSLPILFSMEDNTIAQEAGFVP